GLEVGSIRCIQRIGYDVLKFLGVWSTLDIFQNIHAWIRHIFLHGYDVLVVRIVIFKISSFKLQNARLLTDIDNNDDELFDVEMEEITGYGASDFVREDDVVIPNRDLGEGRSGGKKGKKGDWSYTKEKNEGELPKKDKGVLLRSSTKGKNGAYIRSPSKKGVQGQSSADKGKAKDLQGTYKGELLTAMGKYGNNQMFYSKMNLIINIDPEAKQWLVDKNPNSWCRAFFKMDRGYAAYENGVSESYHNVIRIARDVGDVGPSVADPTIADPIVADPTVV
nr:hypothetical protein CTI12_AA159120 [Tanacetum cinerariifolium]